MKKIFVVAISLVMFACNPEPAKVVNVEGDWRFDQFVEGEAELVPENQMMVKSIVNLFDGCSMSLNDGEISLTSGVAGKREGTYTVVDGKLNVQFGANSQFSLHVENQDSTALLILFNEGGEKETGKIVLLKQ